MTSLANAAANDEHSFHGMSALGDTLKQCGMAVFAHADGVQLHSAAARASWFKRDAPAKEVIPYEPYVQFIGSESFARKLQHEFTNNVAKLHYNWQIIGQFHPETLEFIWMIKPDCPELKVGKVSIEFVEMDIALMCMFAKDAVATLALDLNNDMDAIDASRE